MAHHRVNFSIACFGKIEWQWQPNSQFEKHLSFKCFAFRSQIRDSVTHMKKQQQQQHPVQFLFLKCVQWVFPLILYFVLSLSLSFSREVFSNSKYGREKRRLGTDNLQQRITEKSVFSANFFCVTALLFLSLHGWGKKRDENSALTEYGSLTPNTHRHYVVMKAKQ